jgi:cbb3-type cytochrome oxidase maturation protein
MNVLYLLVPLALLLAGAGVAAFVWSVRNGQYDDVETPAMRILMEDDVPGPTSEPHAETDEASPEARE